MKAPLFLLVLSLYALNSSAGVFEHPVDNLSGRSLENPNITGNFLQKRFIPELKTEIISSGKFSINKERGVLWQNLTPFQSTTIISGALICSLTEQDSSVKSTPALKEFLDLINALFSQDFDVVSKHFHIFFEAAGDNFTIGLRAKSPAIAKSVSELTAEGSKYIEKVKFSNDKGDINTLEFSNITEGSLTFSCEQ